MATVTKGYTFTPTETLTSTKLHTLVDSATVTGIENDDISSDAAIADSKLATIATDGKVNISALVAASQAAGDIIYCNGTAWVRLGIGTAGQTLKVNGAATAPEWA